jgi:hypothetical protein
MNRGGFMKILNFLMIAISTLGLTANAKVQDIPANLNCDRETTVVVDCKTHQVEFWSNGLKRGSSDIDCGKSGLTKVGQGYIGGYYPPGSERIANTQLVGGVIDINIPGLGLDGDAVVFHQTPPYKSGAQPSKSNSSKGCVHITQNVLKTLSHCEGAKLKICNADKAGCGEPSKTSPSDSANAGAEFFGEAFR